MRAVLLAAGLGTRLRPLTDDMPKCLVPIYGRPLLDYWLENLLDQGVKNVLINTHYLAPMVHNYINHSTWKSRVTIVHEESLLGTGGTILKNRDFLQNEPFLVAHADNLTIFDVCEFASSHANRPLGTEITMMVFNTDTPQSCGVVELDNSGVLQTFHEKVANPPSSLANAAIYIFEPQLIEWLEILDKKVIDLSTEVIPNYLGKIFTYQNKKYHRDIGTLISWQQANQDFPDHNIAKTQNIKAWNTVISKNETLIKTYLKLKI